MLIRDPNKVFQQAIALAEADFVREEELRLKSGTGTENEGNSSCKGLARKVKLQFRHVDDVMSSLHNYVDYQRNSIGDSEKLARDRMDR